MALSESADGGMEVFSPPSGVDCVLRATGKLGPCPLRPLEGDPGFFGVRGSHDTLRRCRPHLKLTCRFGG